MDYQFLKIKKGAVPISKVSSNTYYDENSVHINLIANEIYIQYFECEEVINTIDAIYIIDNDNTFDITAYCQISKIVDNKFLMLFSFPINLDFNCQYLKISINGDIEYFTNKFTVRDYNNENTTLLTWWHKENKNKVPYYDFKDEIHYPQRLRVNLRFISNFDDRKIETSENTITKSYHSIGVYRAIEIPLELWVNYTSIEHHQSLGRALTSDFVYIENQRYKFKEYQFDVDKDENGIVDGKVECQKIDDDNILLDHCDIVDIDNIYVYSINGLHYLSFNYNIKPKFGFNFSISYDGIIFNDLYELNYTSEGIYTYRLDSLNSVDTHTLRIRPICIDGSGQNFEKLINYNMLAPKTIFAITTNDIPDGYMLCDGNNGIPVTTSLVTNYIIPDLRGRTLFMRDPLITEFASLMQTGGQINKKLLASELPEHNHDININKIPADLPGSNFITIVDGGGQTLTTNNNITTNDEFSLLNPYIVVNYIVYVGI